MYPSNFRRDYTETLNYVGKEDFNGNAFISLFGLFFNKFIPYECKMPNDN